MLLKMKIQNWLVSIEYKQYTQNTNQTLSVDDKESIRRIYSKLGLKPHDLSELTQAGEVFLEKKINEIIIYLCDIISEIGGDDDFDVVFDGNF